MSIAIAQIKTKLVRNEAAMAALIVLREQVLEQLDVLARQRETLKMELAFESTKYSFEETKNVAFSGID